MALTDITDPNAVLRAVEEFDAIGREAFLARYGFAKARGYFLVVSGKSYDSKAIVGVAHGYQFPASGPLRHDDFSGGDATVRSKLMELGFTVETIGPESSQPRFKSRSLNIGTVYTREELRKLFGITDATINTGLFQPKDSSSVWVFATEKKTTDRTQYEDLLEGDTLYYQGQTQGRKDDLIINHEERSLELLVFYRKEKYEYAGAGFRYEGPFRYLSHKGQHPSSFVLRRIRDEVTEQQIKAEDESTFDPADVQDGRTRANRSIALRRGQRAFRLALFKAYNGRCALSGCDCADVLEAAHVFPYKGDQTNTPGNGLLLRADLHTLFDLGLIAIDPESMTVIVAGRLKKSSYSDFDGKPVMLPKDPALRPSKEALHWHRTEAGFD